MSEAGNKKYRICWRNTLYLTISPFVAIAGLVWWIQTGQANINTIILTVVLYSLIEISITAGYHRLFSHRSYQASLPVKLFFLFFGAGAFQGTAISWATDHREHHHFVDDNDKDPYSINKGFMWAHMLWLFFKEEKDIKEIPTDLRDDKWIYFQYKNYLIVGITACFLVPVALASLWGDFMGGLLIAGVLRSVLVHHSTFLINSLSHCVGKQTYSDKHTARDNWFTAFLTFGEGYHNYHHEFPTDYRNGIRKYDWDPTKWTIFLLSKLKMAWGLRRVRQDIILTKKMIMAEKRFDKKTANYSSSTFKQAQRVLTRLKKRFEIAAKRLGELVDAQDKNKTIEINYEFGSFNEQLKAAKRELRKAFYTWYAMNKRVLKFATA